MDKIQQAGVHRLGLSEDQLNKVDFLVCDDPKNLLVREGTIALFSEPIYLAPGIRLSPLYPSLGSTEDGVIYDRFTMKPLEPRKVNTNENTYQEVRNWHLAITPLKVILVHRVCASAWCKNSDPCKFDIINHLDGNKSNNHYTNLEWTDNQGNIRHAFETGLSSLKVSCMVKDIQKETITIYGSLKEAADAINSSQSALASYISVSDTRITPIYGKYEVKLITDKTPWKFNSLSDIKPRSHHEVTVTYPNGEEEVYLSLAKFGKKFLGYSAGLDMVRALSRAKLRYPELVFDYSHNLYRPTIEILEIRTGKKYESSSVSEIATILGRSKSYVKTNIRLNTTMVSDTHTARIKSDKPWDIPTKFRRRRIVANVTKLETGEVKRYTTIDEIHRDTGINRKAIARFLEIGDYTHNGYHFVIISDKHG